MNEKEKEKEKEKETEAMRFNRANTAIVKGVSLGSMGNTTKNHLLHLLEEERRALKQKRMSYVEAPKEPLGLNNDPRPIIFLCGGITGVPNWQQTVKQALADYPVILFNPRRENFPMDDSSAAALQIAWEYHWLNEADLVTFWFAKETIQPIVLYELGRFIDTDTDIIVSVHPDYPRKQDVEVQTFNARNGLVIQHSLEEHVEAIKVWIEEWLIDKGT
jgi:hypothetical protein